VTDAPSTTPRRYLAVWLPFLPADRLRRSRRLSSAKENGCAAPDERPLASVSAPRSLAGQSRATAPDERPLAFVEKVKGALRLAALDRQAVALGLAPGLTLADARARVPDLAVADHDPAADTALLERLADDSDRWSPLVALDPPDGLILDITGCAHLFGGEAAMRAGLLARLKRNGFHARATVAGTPESARALARFGRVAVVAPGHEAEAVRGLPVAALDAPREAAVALIRAGLKTVGHLADRPSLPVAARFGEGLTRRVRRVLGFEDARITPRRVPPACVVEQRFPEPVARREDIEGTLVCLVVEAAGVLEQRGEGGRAFEAAFFRADGFVRRIAVETVRPLREARAVLRLFRERLDALADPLDPGFGFDLIRLAVPATEALNAAQTSLEGRTVEGDEVDGLVERLIARFGQERVLRFAPRDTHQPERAARLVTAAGETRSLLPWPAPEPDEPPLRPLRLFDPPQPIETIAEVPDGPPLRFRWRKTLHEIARAEGPERIAPEWWRRKPGAPTRDYYRLEDVNGRRFWVFRAGLYERETEAPRWYLHGLFP
jgi:protein ImuB